MSNVEARPEASTSQPHTVTGPITERYQPRLVPLGGIRAIEVHRLLPQRRLPTVGAWCFLDKFGPQRDDMRVLPHPHIGLQTVTWPLRGEIRHRDSLGFDVVLRPGQLNLMTSGPGIAHSEFSLGERPLIDGLQLWAALPAAAGEVEPAFERHLELPRLVDRGLRATVFVGDLAGVTSPATTFSPLLGAEVELEPGVDLAVPVRREHEHAVLVLDGRPTVAGEDLEPGPLLYLGTGRDELTLASRTRARLILLGGAPFPEDLVMWWNFVGRDHEEIAAARADWEGPRRIERFGEVAGHDGELIPAPPLPPIRLQPRRRG